MTSKQQQQQQQPQQQQGQDQKQHYQSAGDNSYQHGTPQVVMPPVTPISITRSTASAAPQHSYYGDAHMKPNTGRTNSYEYALFGLALHELLTKIQQCCIVTSGAAVLFVGFTCLTKLFHPVQLLLAVLVGVLSLVLFTVEITTMITATNNSSSPSKQQSATVFLNDKLTLVKKLFTTATTNTSSSEHSNDNVSSTSTTASILQKMEKFGRLVLYHPIGRVLYLSFCAVLCWIAQSLWLTVLSTVYVGNAAVLLYCWCTYPEFRRTFDTTTNDNEETSSLLPQESHDVSITASTTKSWTTYYSDSTPMKQSNADSAFETPIGASSPYVSSVLSPAGYE